MSVVRPGRDELLGVQCLRAVAALLVVAYHAVEQWTTHTPGYAPIEYWPNGSAGVDIFFVISGLVMTISVQRSAGRRNAAWAFSKGRMIRIMPLYWVVTTLKIVSVLALPALATRTTLDPFYVAGSYALLPVRDALGIIRPVLPVGWTLSYEMFFYILIAAALVFRVPIMRVCAPLLLAFAALSFVLPAGSFANTIVIEFIFGIVIGNAVPHLRNVRLTVAAAIGIIAFALLMVVPVGGGFARPLTWGVPAAFIVAATVSTELSLRPWLPQWLLAAGNASYVTYLTHGFVIPAVYLLIRPISANLAAMIVIGLIVSAIAGHATHRFIEQPLQLRLKTRRAASTLPAVG